MYTALKLLTFTSMVINYFNFLYFAQNQHSTALLAATLLLQI